MMGERKKVVFLEKDIIVVGDFVETKYRGHNSCISICGFMDAPGTANVCRLEHEIEQVNVPVGLFRKDSESGKYELLLDFSRVQCSPEQWETMKRATDEMMALWEEFLELHGQQVLPRGKPV